MQFLKTLLWIAVAVAVALFAIRNDGPVTVNLWSDLQMITPLWVVVTLSFLAGLVPALLFHRTARWRWRRKFEMQERALVDSKVAPHSTTPEHLFGNDTLPPAATPVTPPPAGI